MRVTQTMLAQNSLRYISKSYERLGKIQDQLSTGKKITRPSDDPVVAMKGMYYRTNVTEVEQYKRNISEIYQWIETSESGIEHTNKALQRVRELLVQALNGTNSESERGAIAAEIKQIKQDIVNVANTQVAGRYIFNGTDTDKPPVADGNPPVATLNPNPFMVEVSKNVKLQANVNPENVFSQDLFNTLQDIQDALEANDSSNLNNLLSQLDGHLDTLNAEWSELGARYNRVEFVEQRLQNQEVVANRILSENEDADLEKVIIDLKTQESVHRAALSAGARIIQPTLVDFLR
ncbi:flagellar hook-associated protein FlgL [Aeribacillus alveayuensis]|uniref:Flagellar hook-associated protein 3 FlgL n=1 Tax=Aeribacillus alveayuensis TaxID=279215 RepID=A0ABT9VLS1_9BACI|nr:flagellar hook-associated protein 3 FlgL [Bacillus alveayuensis]